MKRGLVAFLLVIFSLQAHADGLPLSHGRYVGEVLTLELTSAQKETIDRFRTCHLENFKTMNAYTPYVFQLTEKQSNSLAAKVGFSPKKFEVYETYKGVNDAGPHWNLALRFSESEIEIPLNLLLPDSKAKKAHKAQGWNPANPCFPELGKQ